MLIYENIKKITFILLTCITDRNNKTRPEHPIRLSIHAKRIKKGNPVDVSVENP